MSVVSEDITSKNDNSELILNDFSIPVIDIKNDKKDENKEQLIIEDKAVEESKNNGTNNLENTVNKNIPAAKVVIISIMVVLFTLTGVYFLANYNSNKEKVVNCSYSFNDKNYKITDEYKITYNSKKITYIEGIYIYTSKADEYDEQIKYIKEDKLPPIINSNGMKGFTYTYENTNDSIKIYSYLDYTIMDEEEINSIDQDIKPVSYFKVDLKSNSENLTDLFKKQGYKCVTSK